MEMGINKSKLGLNSVHSTTDTLPKAVRLGRARLGWARLGRVRLGSAGLFGDLGVGGFVVGSVDLHAERPEASAYFVFVDCPPHSYPHLWGVW